MAEPIESEQNVVLQPGEFEGPYLDANGHRGTLRFSLAADGEKLKGQCKLILRAADEPEVYEGDLAEEFNSKSGKLTLTLARVLSPEEKAEQTEELESLHLSIDSDVHVSDAGSFAQQSMYGVIPASPGSGLGGGVWIVWCFKQLGPEKE